MNIKKGRLKLFQTAFCHQHDLLTCKHTLNHMLQDAHSKKQAASNAITARQYNAVSLFLA